MTHYKEHCLVEPDCLYCKIEKLQASEISLKDDIIFSVNRIVKLEARVEELEGLIRKWEEAGRGIILNTHQIDSEYLKAANALRESVGGGGMSDVGKFRNIKVDNDGRCLACGRDTRPRITDEPIIFNCPSCRASWNLECGEVDARVTDQIAKMKQRMNLDSREIERLQSQVKELEEYLDDAANSFQSLLRDHEKIMYLNHITDKQIDAAWKHGEKVPYSVITLSKLNIHRCESPGCDHGMYTEGNDDGSDTMTRACEICNGGGWVPRCFCQVLFFLFY